MSREKPLYVVIAGCDFSFPLGEAPASRARLLALALHENGAEVKVLNFNYSERASQVINLEKRGSYKGIGFEYTTGTTIRSQFFIYQCWVQLKGLIVGIWRLMRLSSQGQLDCVCLEGRRLRVTVPIIFICRLLKVPVVWNLCEWWPAHDNCSGYEKKVFFRYILQKISGVISISEGITNKLRAIYEKKGTKRPILKVPILVDADQWQMPYGQSDSNSGEYILWCGNLACYSQIVEFLMRAMVELLDMKKNVILKLVGTVTPSQIKQFRGYQHNLGLAEEKVQFVGYKRQDELKEQFRVSKALLVPSRNTEREVCGFHTKTGEYLASGRPVVATNIGEPAKYFKNEVDAILCKPEDEKDFARGIKLLLNSPETAKAIGRAGQELAKDFFDYRIHGPRIVNFIREEIIAKECSQ